MKLKDFAQVIRSKNSGPFEITFDIIFKSEADYNHFKNSQALTKESFATLYHLSPEDVITFEYFDPARCLKITIPRPWAQGSIGESDMHGSQQYAPLLDIIISE